MKRIHFALAGLALAMMPPFSSANETIADIPSNPALQLNRPADRALAVERMRLIRDVVLYRAGNKTKAIGLQLLQDPVRGFH